MIASTKDSEGKELRRKTKDCEPLYLRGYCRVCNRHYFFRNKLDTDHVQFHQHHGGVCQICHYACARIKSKTHYST